MLTASASADFSADAPAHGIRIALPVSLVLHTLIALVLVFSLSPHPLKTPPVRTVAVDLISPEAFEAMRRRGPGTAAQAPQAGAPASANDLPQDDMIQAEAIMSEKALADPRNRQAREALPGLAADERILQICNLEALEQVQVWNPEFSPSHVVAYAMAEIRISPQVIEAGGGALRSHGLWYALKYRCTVSPDRGKVVAFAFRVGDPIPRGDWEHYALQAGEDMHD